MKKIVFSVSICLLLSGVAMAQQQDSTFMNGSKSNNKSMEKNRDKKYSDSSGKYAPYGDPNDNTKKSKGSKNKGKRDKVDSVNPKM